MKDKALRIINRIPYITVATVDNMGQPWNSPVSAFHDESNNFYWASWVENQHSKNIKANSKVFIVIYDSKAPEGTGEGVYIRANAYEINDEKELIQIQQYDKNPQNPKKFLGSSPRRFYKAVPEKMWLNDEGEIDGFYVDVRKEVV